MKRKPNAMSFRPRGWFSHVSSAEYSTWACVECGRLGIGADEIYSKFRVLHDLLNTRLDLSNEGMRTLLDWTTYDLRRLSERDDMKPRIDVVAEITSKENLIVRWYPRGYKEGRLVYKGNDERTLDTIYPEPWDFKFFRGDEMASGFGRPPNELMFLREVGNLRPDIDGTFGPIDRSIVDGVLICAVRRAYEELVETLSVGFEVRTHSEFDFEIREEERLVDGVARKLTRVVGWRLVDLPSRT